MSAARVALRIARRDAQRHRGRSLLVVALIALPVLAGVAIDVILRSGSPTTVESINHELAGSDAWVLAQQGVTPIEQDYPDALSTWQTDDHGRAAAALPPADVLTWLPRGSQITLWQRGSVPVKGTDARYRSVLADQLDITAPAAGARYTVVRGDPPSGHDQVALTAGLAEDLGLGIGDVVSAGAPANDYRITGIVDSGTGGPAELAIVARPGSIAVLDQSLPDRYLVRSPTPITWAMVGQLNAHGIAAYSRAAVLDPTAPLDEKPGIDRTAVLATAAGVVLIAMLLLQVVFLAGPAFAVGARRMRRQLGQLVATGAAPRHVRWVVLASGLVLGVVGAVVGAAAGVVVALAIHPILGRLFSVPWWSLHLPARDVLVLAALGVVTAVLAALLPALSAGRAHPVALLGRPPASPHSAGWWSIAGAVGCLAGIAVTIIAATRPVPVVAPEQPPPSLQGRGIAIAVGVLLVEIGLITATPLILQIAARIGAVLPTPGRLALRDAARHRGRTAPAVAAIMAASSAAVAAAIFFTTLHRDANAGYLPALRVGQVSIQLNPYGYDAPGVPQPIDRVRQAVAAEWPDATVAGYQRAGDPSPDRDREIVVPPENACPWTGDTLEVQFADQDSKRRPDPDELPAASHDWRCAGFTFSALTPQQAGTHPYTGYFTWATPRVVIGGPDLRAAVTGLADPRSDAVLAGGGAVVFDRSYLAADGTLRSAIMDYDADSGARTLSDPRAIPATLGRWASVPVAVILSPQAATELGLTGVRPGLLVTPTAMPDDAQLTDLTQQLAATAGVYAGTYLEVGYWPYPDHDAEIAWLVLAIACLLIAGTVAVVTALGITDAAPDLATLAAVGAPPRTRRLLSGYSAGLIAALGCLLGTALGLVPAYGVLTLAHQLGNTTRVVFAVPWTAVAILAVGLPVAAFVIGAAVARSRVPMVARLE